MYVKLDSIYQDINRCLADDHRYHGPSKSEIHIKMIERENDRRKWETEVIERELDAIGGMGYLLDLV